MVFIDIGPTNTERSLCGVIDIGPTNTERSLCGVYRHRSNKYREVIVWCVLLGVQFVYSAVAYICVYCCFCPI